MKILLGVLLFTASSKVRSDNNREMRHGYLFIGFSVSLELESYTVQYTQNVALYSHTLSPALHFYYLYHESLHAFPEN